MNDSQISDSEELPAEISSDDPTSDVQPWRRKLVAFAELTAVLAGLATLTAILARVNWIFELSSHFRVQYMITAGISACILMYVPRWRMF